MALSLLELAAKLNDRTKCDDIYLEEAEIRRYYYALNLADTVRLLTQIPLPPKEDDFSNEPKGVQDAYRDNGGATQWAADRKRQIILAVEQLRDATTIVEGQIQVDATMAVADRTDAATVKDACIAKVTAVNAAQAVEMRG